MLKLNKLTNVQSVTVWINNVRNVTSWTNKVKECFYMNLRKGFFTVQIDLFNNNRYPYVAKENNNIDVNTFSKIGQQVSLYQPHQLQC